MPYFFRMRILQFLYFLCTSRVRVRYFLRITRLSCPRLLTEKFDVFLGDWGASMRSNQFISQFYECDNASSRCLGFVPWLASTRILPREGRNGTLAEQTDVLWNGLPETMWAPRTTHPLRQRQNAVYLVFCSPAVCSCCSSAFCQLELELYSFMALARTSVFLPRSFWYTTPSSLTMKVITPHDLYSAG
jgi:hypothetical protein